MNTLHFSANIIRLRHEKNLTQEQLADFLGITKASVSKWENQQSLPDIMLLPRLAAFFDVTIDDLLGYEPQLSREQIQKIYHGLATDFTQLPFEEVIRKSQSFAKKYYSCYPFLLQICTLWLNHFMLAETPTRQQEILTDISDLCDHVISDCKDISHCNDALILRACANLQLGKAQDAIENLEEILNPYRLSSQSDTLLIQAYMMTNKTDRANSFAQISMFVHLLSFVADATQYLAVHNDNLTICTETIRRIDMLMEVYHIEHLHPNSAALFHYQAALVYCMYDQKREALKRLKQYASLVRYILADDNVKLHGDDYFDTIDPWFEESDYGATPPRSKKFIIDNALQSLSNPGFSVLNEEADFQNICRILKKESEII